MHRALLLILPVVLAIAFTLTAQASDAVSASFDGVLETTGEKQMKISLSGVLYWSAPNLRVDFSQTLTHEDVIALVDFNSQQATLLYPDTLNGQQFDLNAFSKAGYLQRVRDLVSTKPGDTPPGWKSSDVEDEEAKAAGQTHTLLTGPDGEKVDLWRDADSIPVRMLIATPKWTLNITLTDVTYGKPIGDGKFAYSDDYTVTKVDKLPEGELPGL